MTTPSSPAHLLDTIEALSQFDNDNEFYADLLRDFLDALPALANQAGQALQAGLLPQAAEPLHTIKGMTLALGAKALSEFTLTHERRCKQGDASLDGPATAAALLRLAEQTAQAARDWLAGAGR